MSATPVKETDLPALYRKTDELSADNQKAHFRGHRLLILLLLAGAIASVLGLVAEPLSRATQIPADRVQQAFMVLAVLAFVGGLLMTAQLRSAKTAEAWYDARAVAESVKSMAWKYMMRAAPYDSEREADKVFREELAELLGDLRVRLTDTDGQPLQGAKPGDGGPITARMRAIRGMTVEERLAVYVQARLEDQQAWYERRGAENRAASRRWVSVTLGLNGIALSLALIAILWAPAKSLLGVVTTGISCAITWTQLRRYGDLAHAYAFESHQIGLQTSDARDIITDEDLARFVADCESTFSREHMMWRARRKAPRDHPRG